ncbi:MAG: DUF6250 domain-containing protein [Pseudomonadota bacterium]
MPRTFSLAASSLTLLVTLALTVSSCQEKRPRRYADTTRAGLTGGQLIFEDDFSKGLDHWTLEGGNWRIVDGALYTGDRSNDNKGAWLKEALLPRNTRIEFDARSVRGNNEVFEADIKCEFGGAKPEHIAGYVMIFGGWKNSLNTIARLEEHTGRMVTDTSYKIEEDKTYRISLVRLGSDIKWFINGNPFLAARDAAVLTGGNFGFNNWNSRFYVDNLKIFKL